MNSTQSLRRAWGLPIVVGLSLAILAYVVFRPAEASESPPRDIAVADSLSAAEVSDGLDKAMAGFSGQMPESGSDYQRATAQQLQGLSKSGSDDRFESGMAESLVVDIWRCAWEGEFLNATKSGDSERADSAAAELGTLYDLNYAKKYYDDPGREWESAVLKPALRGDLSGISNDFAQCQDGA